MEKLVLEGLINDQLDQIISAAKALRDGKTRTDTRPAAAALLADNARTLAGWESMLLEMRKA